MNKSAQLTPSELSRALGVSVQTVRRWIKHDLVPYKLNKRGWFMVRIEDVPPELIQATKRLSGSRMPSFTSKEVDPSAEIAFLRQQVIAQSEIIARLLGSTTRLPGEAEAL